MYRLLMYQQDCLPSHFKAMIKLLIHLCSVKAIIIILLPMGSDNRGGREVIIAIIDRYLCQLRGQL